PPTPLSLHPFPTRRSSDLAHVGHAPVRRQEAGARGIPAVLSADEIGVPLRLLDLTRDAGDHDVATQPDSCLTQGTHGFDVTGERSEEHTSELQSPDHLVCR